MHLFSSCRILFISKFSYYSTLPFSTFRITSVSRKKCQILLPLQLCRKSVKPYSDMFLTCPGKSLNTLDKNIHEITSNVHETHRPRPASSSCEPSELRLEEYDCVGFDLDNTLCEYNIASCVEMEYNTLANFLVQKGYDSNYLFKPLDKSSIDFLHKGLVLDFNRGNLLRIGENGVICKASHGTRFMTNKEIVDIYGKDKKWVVTSEFCQNMTIAWSGPLSERMRALLDYFDMPVSLAFARIIDSLDDKIGRPADIYNIWPDVYAGLLSMYKREHFSGSGSGYFQELKSNPLKYIHKCSPNVIQWLKTIKQSKLTYLITGSNCDFVSLTAETSLGKDWRSLFDIVVCYARKPGFFTGCRPFIELEGFQETNPVEGNNLEIGKIYSQGNWQELYQLFGRTVGKKEPRCLYFGDNVIQDVYTPSEFTKCDSVAIVKELAAERTNKAQLNVGIECPTSREILLSNSWGSYFFDEGESLHTVWGSIINTHSKVCISDLSELANTAGLPNR